MGAGEKISCQVWADHLVAQNPVYDKKILRDVRPTTAGLMGYYKTGSHEPYSNSRHIFDRMKSVQPDLTKPWTQISGEDCTQKLCDLDANMIGWGYERSEYGLENQEWKSQLLCFPDIMLKTDAREHMAQIIDGVLRPATGTIMGNYLSRKAAELAGRKVCVTTGLPDFTFTWDAGGNVYLNTSADPTGRLTAPILQSYVRPLYAVGATTAGMKGYENLQLHTDEDTFRYLQKDDPNIKNAWRFGDFSSASKEFNEYGLAGFVGDFMVKVLMWPLRFNQIAPGRYQIVFPYKNVAVTSGIGSVFNEDYNRAQFQFSYINNPLALEVQPLRAEAVNPMMPFLIRDFGGKWRFAIDNLGADCNGKAIANYKRDKGLFYASFELSIKPSHPEWLYLFFHKVDLPCVIIVDTCNTLEYPYPAQDYDSEAPQCPSVFVFNTATKEGTYQIAANTIIVDGNVIVNSAINVATLALLVAALPSVSGGTWAIDDEDAGTIKLSDSTATSVDLPFLV